MRLWYCSLFFFFFKQKTAYEMRISDWSSDVCSSDLSIPCAGVVAATTSRYSGLTARGTSARPEPFCLLARTAISSASPSADAPSYIEALETSMPVSPQIIVWYSYSSRSEEHTSELQSLMRISYAVFCLKKKTQTQK